MRINVRRAAVYPRVDTLFTGRDNIRRKDFVTVRDKAAMFFFVLSFKKSKIIQKNSCPFGQLRYNACLSDQTFTPYAWQRASSPPL